jgi:2-polyprenyl-6-methoxyphenol hydroxylase-like FAD-dependent oxidoreductase
MAERVGDRAVVLGGSMAGLLAARVLAESYAEVLVVDRDSLTGVAEPRRGVPQGNHVHGLLARGQQILEEMFPGFTAEAVASGVPTADLGELRWFFNGRRLHPVRTGLVCISAGRPVLESLVRGRVAGLPNVAFIEHCDIVGLVTSADATRVTGARLHRRTSDSAEVVEADLVVDATGRGSRTPVWLAEFGYHQPAEERVKIGLSYTSRLFRSPSDDVLGGHLSINPVASPAFPRGAFCTKIDNGRLIVSLTGVLGDRAPTNPAGFLDYARSLPVPDVYDVVRDAEPISDAVSFTYPASVRRRYDRLDRMPQRLIVLGDAACSFNPVYGQGMTVAALEALTLRSHLAEGAAPEPLRFQRDISDVIDAPWEISAGGDLGFPGVEGERPLKVRMANAYMARLHAAATRDGSITEAFMRAAGLVDPPQSLLRPGLVMRVLRKSRGAGGTGSAPASPASVAADQQQQRRAA